MNRSELIETVATLIGAVLDQSDALERAREELDDLRAIAENADQYLVDLETRERERLGVSTLKLGYNRVHGYYIEISKTQADKAPVEYVRRQTLKAAERYITPELKEFEDKVLGARERALAREKYLYEELLDKLHALDPQKADIVEARFFGGLENEEIAASLGISARTVQRQWQRARAWMHAALDGLEFA